MQEPITGCQDETCVTVSSNCENSLCGFLEDGALFPSGIKVTETKEIDLLTIGPCSADVNVLAVAVGGGGTDSGTAGAGSGYVEFQELQFSSPYVQFEAKVARDDEYPAEETVLSTI